MGFTVSESLSTTYGINVTDAYFNIDKHDISIGKNEEGKFELQVIFNMYNSHADRLADPPKRALGVKNFRYIYDAIPVGNIYTIAYDLYKANYITVVDL